MWVCVRVCRCGNLPWIIWNNNGMWIWEMKWNKMMVLSLAATLMMLWSRSPLQHSLPFQALHGTHCIPTYRHINRDSNRYSSNLRQNAFANVIKTIRCTLAIWLWNWHVCVCATLQQKMASSKQKVLLAYPTKTTMAYYLSLSLSCFD